MKLLPIPAGCPCPTPTRQWMVMFVLYGGVQAALGAVALGLYGGRWALVGAAIGLGAGVVFASVMLLWTSYRALQIDAVRWRLLEQAAQEIGLGKLSQVGEWSRLKGKGLESIAACIYYRPDEEGVLLVAPRGFFSRLKRERKTGIG